MSRLHDFAVPALDGDELRFAKYRGRAVLLAVVACGEQWRQRAAALEALWRAESPRGLMVVGLCDLRWCKALGAELHSQLRSRLGLSFPLSAPLDLASPARHALARWLTGCEAPFPGGIHEPFESFLCDDHGRLVGRIVDEWEPLRLRAMVAPFLV